jgi:hypothetical protein
MNKLIKQCPCCGRVNVADEHIARMHRGAQLIRAGITENHIVEYINQAVKKEGDFEYSRFNDQLKNDRVKELTEENDRMRREIERLKMPSLWQRLKAKVKRHA